MSNKKIYVRSARDFNKDGGSEIVFYEKNELHPDGELFIADPSTWVPAYPTAQLRRAIAEERVIEKESPNDPAAPKWEPTEADDVPMGDMGDAAAADKEKALADAKKAEAAVDDTDIDDEDDEAAKDELGNDDEKTSGASDAANTDPAAVNTPPNTSTDANAFDPSTFQVADGETVESLEKRLNKTNLTALAAFVGAEFTADNNKSEIAESILVTLSK